jgi:hypothetical protein
MAWRQEETNLVRTLIIQGPMAIRTKIDTRVPRRGEAMIMMTRYFPMTAILGGSPS